MADEYFTISAFSENSPGVLQRITDLFTRRKLNIESLTVSETERKGVSRFTIVVRGDRTVLEKVGKQINRIVEVRDVFVSENEELLYKEIAFIKLETKGQERRIEIEELAHRYGATAVYADVGHLVIEKTGTEEEVNYLYLLLEPFGIVEFVRSGRIAILKRRPEVLPAPAPVHEVLDPRGEM